MAVEIGGMRQRMVVQEDMTSSSLSFSNAQIWNKQGIESPVASTHYRKLENDLKWYVMYACVKALVYVLATLHVILKV